MNKCENKYIYHNIHIPPHTMKWIENTENVTKISGSISDSSGKITLVTENEDS